MNITKKVFGKAQDKDVFEYTLENDNGMQVSIITYGATVRKIIVPDKEGNFENVVLGFDNIGDYVERSPYFGATVGRVAGRISGAHFSLPYGHKYDLPKNEGENHLHGNGEFSHAIWKAEPYTSEEIAELRLKYVSPDGSNGYPGKVETSVNYTLENDNSLVISYFATTSKDTLLNLTNHTYFNLSGNMKTTVCDHILKADVDSYIPVKEDLTPTGTIEPVFDTSFDFSKGHKLLDGMTKTNVDIAFDQNEIVGNGYDHALVFRQNGGACKGINLATIRDENSGRILQMTTDYPCFVLYSGNQLDGSIKSFGNPATKYTGVCLEAQLLPDAPNHKNFGSILLQVGETYFHQTKYHFHI